MAPEGGEEREFESFVEELERRIDAEERALYSPQVLEHARRPRNFGRLPRATGSAVVRGPCGDTMGIDLAVGAHSRVREARFVTDGCGSTVACGSMLTSMVRGKTLQEAGRIDAEELIDALGGLPQESLHCAELAVRTLRAALAKAGGDRG